MPTIWTAQQDIDFAAEMYRLITVFGRKADPTIIETYRETLGQYLDGDQAIAGVRRSIEECERFPPPVMVKRHAGGENVSGMQMRVEQRPAIRDKLASQGVEMSKFDDKQAERRKVREAEARKLLDG